MVALFIVVHAEFDSVNVYVLMTYTFLKEQEP